MKTFERRLFRLERFSLPANGVARLLKAERDAMVHAVMKAELWPSLEGLNPNQHAAIEAARRADI